MNKWTEDKRMLEYGLMLPYSNIFCFSTTRHGGFGKGTYDSFNCTPYTGDDSETVLKNQALLQSLLPSPNQLVIPYQTHGTQILLLDEKYMCASPAEREACLQEVDALITNLPGYCLCISTADCIPILLYDKQHQAIAAVHAGWRGTVNFIVGHTLERMRAVYGTVGQEVVACIGPGISLESFEVGDEVYEAFRLNGFDMSRISCRNANTGKFHIDLWETNRQQLLDFGVPSSQIEVAGICTYIHHEEFFSARRLGIASGRILSGILIIN